MARTVLVIHGAGEPRRRQGKVYWEPLVGQALGRGYVLRAPRMPRPAAPKYWAWARRIDELMAGLREPLLIGHSFGASVLLKYLSETVRRPAIAASSSWPHLFGDRTSRNLRYHLILGCGSGNPAFRPTTARRRSQARRDAAVRQRPCPE